MSLNVRFLPPSPTIHAAAVVNGFGLREGDKTCHHQMPRANGKTGWKCGYEGPCLSQSDKNGEQNCNWPKVMTDRIDKKG